MTENDAKPRARKGKTSPQHNLSQAVDLAREIFEHYNDSPCSRESIATSLGHEKVTGPVNTKIGSLTHFSLLDRVGTGSYQISDLAKRILMPSSDADLGYALREAALAPSLYSEVASAFDGKAIPAQFGNILSHNYGVLSKKRDDVADTFRATVEFAGLLKNGIFTLTNESTSRGPQLAVEALKQMQPQPDQFNSSTAKIQTSSSDSSIQELDISLGLDGRSASIRLPVPISQRDLERIIAWATYMKGLADEAS